MDLRKSNTLAVVLGLASVGLLVCFAYLSYKVGCTADLKAGAHGDVQAGLRMANLSTACLIAGLACGSLKAEDRQSSQCDSRLLLPKLWFTPKASQPTQGDS